MKAHQQQEKARVEPVEQPKEALAPWDFPIFDPKGATYPDNNRDFFIYFVAPFFLILPWYAAVASLPVLSPENHGPIWPSVSPASYIAIVIVPQLLTIVIEFFIVPRCRTRFWMVVMNMPAGPLCIVTDTWAFATQPLGAVGTHYGTALCGVVGFFLCFGWSYFRAEHFPDWRSRSRQWLIKSMFAFTDLFASLAVALHFVRQGNEQDLAALRGLGYAQIAALGSFGVPYCVSVMSMWRTDGLTAFFHNLGIISETLLLATTIIALAIKENSKLEILFFSFAVCTNIGSMYMNLLEIGYILGRDFPDLGRLEALREICGAVSIRALALSVSNPLEAEKQEMRKAMHLREQKQQEGALLSPSKVSLYKIQGKKTLENGRRVSSIKFGVELTGDVNESEHKFAFA